MFVIAIIVINNFPHQSHGKAIYTIFNVILSHIRDMGLKHTIKV